MLSFFKPSFFPRFEENSSCFFVWQEKLKPRAGRELWPKPRSHLRSCRLQPLVVPDLEHSAQGLANLGCRADFSGSCSDFHSLLCCQDNPELCKNVSVWISLRIGQFATRQELCGGAVPGSSQASHTHLGINVRSSGCSPSPVVEKKDRKKQHLERKWSFFRLLLEQGTDFN